MADETEGTEEENLDGLARLNVEWVDRAMAQTSHQRVILDMDSSASRCMGSKRESPMNGHFESVCYHPLSCSTISEIGHQCFARATSTAERWREVLEPVVKRYQEKGVRLLPGRCCLCQARGVRVPGVKHFGYAMRKTSGQRGITRKHRHLLKRPVGRLLRSP